MQITEQLIERIARNVFKSMFSQALMNANVVTGDTIDHADKADESKRLGDQTVGSATKPFYLDDGTPTESNASVGDSSTPVYIDGGTFTVCTGVATSNDISDINDDISDINDEIVDIWDAIHDLQPTQ
jgi:hypothetical protein